MRSTQLKLTPKRKYELCTVDRDIFSIDPVSVVALRDTARTAIASRKETDAIDGVPNVPVDTSVREIVSKKITVNGHKR